MQTILFRWKGWALLFLSVACLFFSAIEIRASQSQDTKQETKSAATPPPIDYQAEGSKVFQANCSRCHMAPMSIPPRITGTVITHMRVRARLSRRDEQILLKFMAP